VAEFICVGCPRQAHVQAALAGSNHQSISVADALRAIGQQRIAVADIRHVDPNKYRRRTRSTVREPSQREVTHHDKDANADAPNNLSGRRLL
jgi:hypothetical protein